MFLLTNSEIRHVVGGDCLAGKFSWTNGGWFDVPSLPGGTSTVWSPGYRLKGIRIYCNGTTAHICNWGDDCCFSCPTGSSMALQGDGERGGIWVTAPRF